ncbi:MAG: hypothetical protein RB292_03015 [Patescibacteria group bacterium]|jgi:hypothetical protein|nr:hypothetical protein [Patescibacteria group bacterium]
MTAGAKRYQRFKLVFILMLVIFSIIYLGGKFIMSRNNVRHVPFLADKVLVVLNNHGSEADNLGNVEFLLRDIQEFTAQGSKVALIGSNQPQANTDLAEIIKYSAGVYVDMFNNNRQDQSLISEFDNQFNLGGEFLLKSYLSENNNLRIAYDAAQRRIDFVLASQPLNINGQPLNIADVVVYAIEDVSSDYLLRIGELVIDLSGYQNNFSVSVQDLLNQSISLYRLENDNLLAGDNYSFEQGYWSQPVGDCSAYLPGNPDLQMELTSDATQGQQSLKLSASNHFACTLKDFNLQLDDSHFYKLSFDYKNISGHKIQYYYSLRNSLGGSEEYFGSLESFDNRWHQFEKVIDYQIESVDQLSVYFYAPSDGTVEVVNLYDNLALADFILDRPIKIDAEKLKRGYDLGQGVILKPATNTFKAFRNDENLLVGDNYSFEQGLWQASAGDCSDYLDGQGDFELAWDNRSTDGRRSLFISSRNHFACTGKIFPVALSNDKLYKLIFDYKTIVGNKGQYYYNLKNQSGQTQEKYDSFEDYEPGWHGLETIIDPKIVNIKSLELIFYAPSDGSGEITTLYDNVRLQEYAPKVIYSYYLKQEHDVLADRQALISDYRVDNFWQTRIKLKNIDGPMLLVYPKQYDPKLSLVIGSDLTVSSQWHYMVNDRQNGWWLPVNDLCTAGNSCHLNSDGSYDLDLTIINHDYFVFRRLTIFLAAFLVILLILMYVAKGQTEID